MAQPPRLIGLGAGGHAKCVIDAITSSGRARVGGLVDVDPATWGGRVLGVQVLGGPAMLGDLLEYGFRSAFIGVGGIPDPATRRIAFDALTDAGFRLPPIAHAASTVSGFAITAAGSQVLAGAIVNADASLGLGSVVGTGAIVGHDAVIGDHTHIAAGARIGGGAIVGREVLIGSGAIVLQGITVGDGAVVGAGAVVTEDVPPAATVVGIPAGLVAA